MKTLLIGLFWSWISFSQHERKWGKRAKRCKNLNDKRQTTWNNSYVNKGVNKSPEPSVHLQQQCLSPSSSATSESSAVLVSTVTKARRRFGWRERDGVVEQMLDRPTELFNAQLTYKNDFMFLAKGFHSYNLYYFTLYYDTASFSSKGNESVCSWLRWNCKQTLRGEAEAHFSTWTSGLEVFQLKAAFCCVADILLDLQGRSQWKDFCCSPSLLLHYIN